MKTSIGKFLVTGLGLGYLPVAPGTWGSLGAAGVFLLTAWASGGSMGVVGAVMAAVALAASVAAVALGPFTERAFGKKDPGKCTIDEWAGQALTCLGLPISAAPSSWLLTAGVAFLAFRMFDIVKPPPARRLEKLPQGWGVLLDDLCAGVYANLCAQLILRLLLPM